MAHHMNFKNVDKNKMLSALIGWLCLCVWFVQLRTRSWDLGQINFNLEASSFLHDKNAKTAGFEVSKYLIRSDKAITNVHEPESWSDPNRVALYVILFKIVSVSVTFVRQAIGFRPKSSAIVDRIHTDCLYYNSLRKYPYVSRGEVLLAVIFFH